MTPGKAPPLSPADVALVLETIADVFNYPGWEGITTDLRVHAAALRATPAEGAPTRDIPLAPFCQKCGRSHFGDCFDATPQGGAGGEAGRVKPVATRLGSGAQPSELCAPQDGAPPATPGGLLDCAKCGYSVVPNEILDAERKHFWNHAYRCVRCLYQSAGGYTWGEAKIEWNRRAGKPVTETGAAGKEARQEVINAAYQVVSSHTMVHPTLSRQEAESQSMRRLCEAIGMLQGFQVGACAAPQTSGEKE